MQKTLARFGFDDWKNILGVSFATKEREKVREFPWSDEILKGSFSWAVGKHIKKRTVAETHFAFVGRPDIKGKPLTMLRLFERFPPQRVAFPRFQMWPIEDYLKTNRFSAVQTPELRWYLMPIQVHPRTLRKNYENGRAALPSAYEVPYAIEEILKDFLYYLKTGECANQNRRALCRDLVSGGDRAAVGPFDPADGLWVGGVWDNPRYDTGVAADRTPRR